MHCASIYSVRLILREFYCCAHGSRCRWHLLNTFSHSLCSLTVLLPLSPSLSLFSLSPHLFFFFFCFDQMERCSTPNLSHSGSQYSESCDPACYLLPLSVCFSLSLSIHKRSLSLFLSVLFPSDKGRQRPFISPRLLVLCVFVLYQTRLPLSLYSLLLFAKKVSRGHGAPALRRGACLSSVREVVEGGKDRRGEWGNEGKKKEQKRQSILFH